MAIVDKAGYYYRHHPGQSVNTADGKVEAVIRNWNEELSWLRSLAGALALDAGTVAAIHNAAGKPLV